MPQRVHNHPLPILFTAQPSPEGETPDKERVYASGQCHLEYLFGLFTTPPSLMDLPRVQAWQNKIAEKLEEPRWMPLFVTYTKTLRIAAATPDVEALNLSLHIPTEQLSGEVRRVVNNAMGLAVMDMQAKAISEEILIPGDTMHYAFGMQAFIRHSSRGTLSPSVSIATPTTPARESTTASVAGGSSMLPPKTTSTLLEPKSPPWTPDWSVVTCRQLRAG
eukprot:1635591-Pleurochrysis_carterae.AAC.1